MDSHLFQQHLLKSWSFLYWVTVSLLSEISWAPLCGSIYGFDSLSIDPPSAIPCSLDYCRISQIVRSGRLVLPTLFSQYCFRQLNSFVFPRKFQNNLVHIYKYSCWDSDRNCVTPVPILRQLMCYLCCLQILECEMSLHLCRLPLIYCISIL